jgi:type I restriction enzyme, S subunit
MSWKKVKLGDILTESKIESDKPDPDKRITVRLNVKGVEKRPFEPGIEGGTKYYVRKEGQFIYGKQNLFKGAFGIVPKELDGFESSQDIPAFDVSKNCLPEWIFYYFKRNDFYKTLESLATGTGSRRIQPARLFEIEIPLPDVKEQKLIIADVVKQEGKFDILFNEIDQQQSYLQLLRQTILQEAVQGKLTKQSTNYEPASELLKRIKAEKQKVIKEGKLKKEKELPPITEGELPFELPKGWEWCRLGELALKSEAGKSLVCDKRPAEKNEWGIIKVSAMSWGEFDEKENKVLPKGVKPFLESKIQKGDYLISRANTDELIGKSVIVNDITSNLLLSDKSVRIIFSDFADKSYVNFYNNSSIAREYYKRAASGTSDSMKNISREQMYLLPVPFPPLLEQQRIVAKVQQLQQQLNALETQVQQNRQYAQQLLQTVLKEAFNKEDIKQKETRLKYESA